jgi:membrane complex biogenesis BtpA family protein
MRIIGVVHLPALPGAPAARLPIERIEAFALREARALRGVDGLVIENFGDAPYAPGRVGPEVVAVMTRVVGAVARTAGVPVGVNVLRTDGVSALAVAHAAGAAFIRVNVLTGVYAAGEGLLTGIAHELLRTRRRIGAERVKIWADVDVKHAAPVGSFDLAQAARDAAYRGGADALIVTGSATGREPAAASLDAVRRAVPDRSLYVGSGLTAANARDLLRRADGAIVGTWLKRGGRISNPVDPARVRALLRRARLT